ncbi:MAG: malto-oligosyltrehalose synthase [Chlamydiales bacterium]
MELSNIPASVYRLQLNADFPLEKAIKILPYLKDLGVEGIYCSPYFDAYSSHGYDVTDPNRLNPKLGTQELYIDFCENLKQLGLKHIIDVIPNHMGIKGGKNRWWQDVLENGPYSEYASFFDINWSPEKWELQDRVLLPILGTNYGKALENQEIKLSFSEGCFSLSYGDFPLPVASHSLAIILEVNSEALKQQLGETHNDWKAYQYLIELYRFFPVAIQDRMAKKQEGKEKLQKLVSHSRRVKHHLKEVVALFNGKKRVADSFDLLDRLLEAQYYRLSFWKVANHEINYRRFFNIHELVALRIEEKQVLEAHHRWVFELAHSGTIQGIRVDHPDGLYDPVCYFEELRSRFSLFTIVEKILDRKETLPSNWKVEGTVGYEYLNMLNGLFIRQESEKEFSEIYEDFIEERLDFEEVLHGSKKHFAVHEMASEVAVLGLKLDRLSERNPHYRDFTRNDLTRALAEMIAFFPVYRTYIGPTGKASRRDQRYISIAIKKAKGQAKDLDTSIFDFFEKLLLIKLKTGREEEERYREFILRFQQLTAPMMAKGLEDTTFYIYNRFISLNEVGGDPTHFGRSVSDFHRFNREKKEKWPFGLVSSSTHDTKRSEDVRMRLNVLSEMPDRWRLEVKKWSRVNSKHKREGPSANTEYFIYQTLVGVWPTHPLKKNEWELFVDRLWDILLKSMREAKQETSWISPDIHYESAVRYFLYEILSSDKENYFLKLFLPFHKEVDRLGMFNSLSATALKIASCGVVDIYQGDELFNYRLVDPDNRKEIDFSLRKKMLTWVKQANPRTLLKTADSSKVKFYIHWKALQFRKNHKQLFLEGEYLPLRTRGQCKDHVIAFTRHLKDQVMIVIVGRFFAQLIPQRWELPLGQYSWGNTEVIIPNDRLKKEWVDLFTEKKIKFKQHAQYATLCIAEVFQYLPISYLI